MQKSKAVREQYSRERNVVREQGREEKAEEQENERLSTRACGTSRNQNSERVIKGVLTIERGGKDQDRERAGKSKRGCQSPGEIAPTELIEFARFQFSHFN